jgi:pimeloyl-ACP methyl ester carboxylesterase
MSEKNFKRKFFQFEKLTLSYLDTETNSNQTILITHANGFSAACYTYILQEFFASHRVIALDFASHGESDSTLDFKDWFFLRDQMMTLIEKENLNEIISIGHSMGGATALLSSKKNPERFKKLILLDPTVLSIPALIYKIFFDFPIAKTAKKRRANFKSLELIRRSFKKFPAFMDWNEKVFEDYLESCFKKIENEFVLACSPVHEYKHFTSSSFSNFFRYGKNKTETHIIIPEKYEVCSPKQAKKIISGNVKSTLQINSELTHFFPFQKTEFTLNQIRNLISI